MGTCTEFFSDPRQAEHPRKLVIVCTSHSILHFDSRSFFVNTRKVDPDVQSIE